MNQNLAINLPDLEKLEWSQQEYDIEFQTLLPFGKFKGLSKLKTDPENVYCLLRELTESLPASLSDLHISGLSPDHFAHDYIQKVARDQHLPRIDLSIIMKWWTLDGRDERQRRELVSTFELERSDGEHFESSVYKLAKAGIEMLIWLQGGHFAEKMLFARYFTMPWPQWGDTDIACQCDRDVETWENYLQVKTQEDEGTSEEVEYRGEFTQGRLNSIQESPQMRY
ncbi:hypothetical protein HBI81_194560 [Parastagonospora nodorum]|nr:hypothetical protein HBI09_201930 [Parastagonospora nodorum]KAH4252943.1 hypothetical protein HBI03_202840 [Parastagonospora nodorum]KAH4263313.1 hypothetical protein HBI04_192860 [Parastagonospora nodorum]KAH4981543.1 hypothetical protein HBI77_220690 [Parastagonospora nodorum]KAH5068605.1 hypothetical protein HBH95_191050 [Parastagonospora nodorum]